nr:peptidyl-tRNA hydrolase, mitochondrial [Tanacetum cinerariifolium]
MLQQKCDREMLRKLFSTNCGLCTSIYSPKPWLFVGLGNLRDKFKGTRHNSGPLAAYYKLPLNRVVVFHDDMDLPSGVLRLQPKGGHGSHNGTKSVIYHLCGNREFARHRKAPLGQWEIDVGLKEGVVALKILLTKGVEESAQVFNNEQKYKHIKVPDIADMSHLCVLEMKNVLPASIKKGLWTREEDELLSSYIAREGEGQ